jgi:hypothetical protein
LRAKLVALEVTHDTARRELAALEARRERLAELERDRDTLMKRYAGMVPEAFDALVLEERHCVYKLLKLKVILSTGRTLEVSGALGDVTEVCKMETLSDRRLLHEPRLRDLDRRGPRARGDGIPERAPLRKG